MAERETSMTSVSTQVSETSPPINTSPKENSSRNHHSRIPVKFKGVVPQQNGHYGAQIYANHQRIWLGTFKSDIEAALAYDSACMKLRTGDNFRNFQLTNVTVHEPKFQSLHSTEAILNMIRDGSYQSKFAEFMKSRKGEHELGLNMTRVHGFGGLSCKLLFQKELTPSDVGKLNRLVVPKKIAVKHFPPISENPEENTENSKLEEVNLFFYDRTMKLWKFRYCYWKSSQSYVFTGGWNRFVKENRLKANDTITLFVCERQEESVDGKTFWVIDAGPAWPSRADIVGKEETTVQVDVKVDLCLRLGQNLDSEPVQGLKVRSDKRQFCFELEPEYDRKKRVMLFGADIN